MKILLNKAHYPVTVLGPGRRIGLWLQGCSIRCRGCVSKDTWDKNSSYECEVEGVVQWCSTVSGGKLDGVTISGGEPFDQPQALLKLLTLLSQWRTRARLKFDVLCYSGYPEAFLRRRHSAILAKLDAIIPEPYKEFLPVGPRWRGSSNQTLIPLSTRGRSLYRYAMREEPEAGKRFQLVVDEHRVWFVGIPMRGDMEHLESDCREQGLDLGEPSWRM